MKSSEILELVRAGYTKEEIAAMEGAAPAADPEPEQDDTPDQEPDADEQDDADEAPNEDDGASLTPNKNAAEMDAIKAQIAAQTKALKRLEDQLLEKKINTGAKGSPDASNNIYDVWAEALNK
jgi:hypothetical protein